MNPWRCPHCGDELLGAVNRCWKCGQRVAPPNFDRLVEAEVVDAQAGNRATEIAVLTAITVPLLTSEEVALAVAKEPPRRGSPFAMAASLAAGPSQPYYGVGPYQSEFKSRAGTPRFQKDHLQPQYPQHSAAMGGVVASLLLGVVSFGILPFSILGGLTAAIGVACGVWGLYCDRKALAIVGLLLCCLALAVALYFVAYALFEIFYPTGMLPVAGGF